MTDEPRCDELGEALRALPRERAREGFTACVVAAAETTAPARPRRQAAQLAAAAALAAVALAGLLWLPRPAADGGAAPGERDRIEALEAERLLLAEELAAIRRLAAEVREPPPVLYLGGDEDVDLVVDLERLARDGGRPAGYRGRRFH